MPAPNNRNRRDQGPAEPKQYEELVINIDRVSRVVKGGRRFRFKALVVVGDRKSKVGVGVAKGADVQVAIQKATEVAKKNFITIPLVNETIPHDSEVKYSGARVLLKPAAPGTGVIAGGGVRAVLESAGQQVFQPGLLVAAEPATQGYTLRHQGHLPEEL